MQYNVANKVGQTKPKWTKEEHDIMKVALNSKQDAIKVLWYDCNGDEGNAITFNGIAEALADLTGKTVIGINRENVELRPADDYPTDNRQYFWISSAGELYFKNDVQPGEQIKITYY